MAETKQICTEATKSEREALLKRSGKEDVKGALNDAMQYFIQHTEE